MPVIEKLADFGGRMLRLIFRSILLVRRPRPIHPAGLALTGTVRWLPGAAAAGIAWIDDADPRATHVVARVSRSAGLPVPLPDVVGLALRFDTPGGPADLELASTGFGFPSRFWLAPHRSPSRARLTTLLPYRGDHGPVLLAARTIAPRDLPERLSALAGRLAEAPWLLTLYHATPTGRWHAFAVVQLNAAGREDTPVRFDAARFQLPGSQQYRWISRLRDPSYRLVQR